MVASSCHCFEVSERSAFVLLCGAYSHPCCAIFVLLRFCFGGTVLVHLDHKEEILHPLFTKIAGKDARSQATYLQKAMPDMYAA